MFNCHTALAVHVRTVAETQLILDSFNMSNIIFSGHSTIPHLWDILSTFRKIKIKVCTLAGWVNREMGWWREKGDMLFIGSSHSGERKYNDSVVNLSVQEYL